MSYIVCSLFIHWFSLSLHSLYKKFNDIPVDPTIKTTSEPTLSKEELLRKKFEYIRKLEKLERKGVKLSKKYTMESSLMEMQGEYEMIINDSEKLEMSLIKL